MYRKLGSIHFLLLKMYRSLKLKLKSHNMSNSFIFSTLMVHENKFSVKVTPCKWPFLNAFLNAVYLVSNNIIAVTLTDPVRMRLFIDNICYCLVMVESLKNTTFSRASPVMFVTKYWVLLNRNGLMFTKQPVPNNKKELSFQCVIPFQVRICKIFYRRPVFTKLKIKLFEKNTQHDALNPAHVPWYVTRYEE